MRAESGDIHSPRGRFPRQAAEAQKQQEGGPAPAKSNGCHWGIKEKNMIRS